MAYYTFVVIVMVGTMTFYALEIVEKGRKWLRGAGSSESCRWRRVIKQCAIWFLLMWLSSCLFTHLVLGSLHRGS